MNEKQLWTFLRKRIEQVPGLEYDRIESHMTSGIPDVTYSYKGCHGWIELKVLTKRRDHFTQAQRAWLSKRWVVGGGHTWLWFLDGEGFGVFPGSKVHLIPESIKEPIPTHMTYYWTSDVHDVTPKDIADLLH